MKHSPLNDLWTPSFSMTLIGMLFLLIPFSLYMPVLPAYLLNEFHSSFEVAGAVNGVFLVAAVLFRVHTARLEVRFGVRRVMLVSGFIFTATNALYLPADSVTAIMLIRFLSGASFAIVTTSIMALGSRLVPRRRLGEGLAYLTAMVLVGGAIGPYIGLKLSQTYGYQSVFLFTTLTALLGLLILRTISVHEDTAVELPRFSLQDLFEVKAIPVSLILLVLSFSYGGVLTFVAVYATELRLPLVTDYFFVVLASASVVARLATGRMYESLGANTFIYLAILTLSGGLLALGSLQTTLWMLTAAALIGIGFGVAVPSLQTLALQFSPRHRSSAVTATFFTFLDGGIGLGAYFLGGAIHAFGYAPVYLSLGFVSVSSLLIYCVLYARPKSFPP